MRLVREVPMQAHFVEPLLVAAVADSDLSRDVHGGRLRGRGFWSRVQC